MFQYADPGEYETNRVNGRFKALLAFWGGVAAVIFVLDWIFG